MLRWQAEVIEETGGTELEQRHLGLWEQVLPFLKSEAIDPDTLDGPAQELADLANTAGTTAER